MSFIFEQNKKATHYLSRTLTCAMSNIVIGYARFYFILVFPLIFSPDYSNGAGVSIQRYPNILIRRNACHSN